MFPDILYFLPKNRPRTRELSSRHSEFRHFRHSQLNFVGHDSGTSSANQYELKKQNVWKKDYENAW